MGYNCFSILVYKTADALSGDVLERLRSENKEQLARIAARNLALHLFGKEDRRREAVAYAAAAWRLYKEEGLDENDYYNQFYKQLCTGLAELIIDELPFEVEDRQLGITLKDEDILSDIFSIAAEKADGIENKYFMKLTPELEDIFRKNADFYDEDERFILLGNYVLVCQPVPLSAIDTDLQPLTWEQVRKGDFVQIEYVTIESEPFQTALGFADDYFMDEENFESAVQRMKVGFAVYRKNGKTDADFRRDFCIHLYKVFSTKLR